MGIAQLMGTNRSDHQAQYKVLDLKTKYHPQLMWFQIVFLDRYLCLMLGLSQGCIDRCMASDAMLANAVNGGWHRTWILPPPAHKLCSGVRRNYSPRCSTITSLISSICLICFAPRQSIADTSTPYILRERLVGGALALYHTA